LLLLELAIIATGRWGFRGFVRESFEEKRLNWYTDLLNLMPHINLILSAVLLAKTTSKSVRASVEHRVIAALILALCAFSTFTQDRRFLFYAGFAGIVFYAEVKRRPLTAKKLFIPAILIGAVLWQAAVFNNFLRSGEAGLDQWQNVNIVDVLADGWRQFQNPAIRSRQTKTSIDNLSKRGLTLYGLAKIMAENPRGLPLYGEDAKNSALVAIPQAIVGPKARYPVQEAIIFLRTGMVFRDLADSTYQSAYLDFGLFGAITHPLFLCGIFIVASYLCSIAHPLIGGIAICPWVYQFFVGVNEAAMSTNFRLLYLATALSFAGVVFFGKSRRLLLSNVGIIEQKKRVTSATWR
jgi:hypothetical protein